MPPGPRQRRGSSPASGPERWTWPKTTWSASTPRRWTTRPSAGRLARRICRPSTNAVSGARRRRRTRRWMPGIVEARMISARSSHSAASGRGVRATSVSKRASDGLRDRSYSAAVAPSRGHAAEQPARDAVARLGQQVAVEVVAVGRVDPVGEPDAGVVHAHAARPERGHDAREHRRRRRRDGRVEPVRPRRSRAASDG